MEFEKEATPSFTCFVCSRCEFPICSSHDIIRKAVPGGTTSSAFVYELEDLLDLESSVPCYSVAEQIETKISIPRSLLDLPESSRARLLGVNSDIVAQSLESTENVQPYVLFRNGESNASAASNAVHSHQHSQRLLMLEEENEEEHSRPQRAPVPRPNNTDSNNHSNQASTGAELENVEEEEEDEEDKEEEEKEQEGAQTFNNTAETRIDLIGVRPCVLNKALKSSSAHLSPSLVEKTEKTENTQIIEHVCECEECGAVVEVVNEHDSFEMEQEFNSGNGTFIHNTNGSISSSSDSNTERIADEVVTPEVTSLPIVPEDVMAAVEQVQTPTQWNFPAGGNYTIREVNMEINRRTASSQTKWFELFDMTSRLECADCHFPLGYLFRHTGTRPSQPKHAQQKASLCKECTKRKALLEKSKYKTINTIDNTYEQNNKSCKTKEVIQKLKIENEHNTEETFPWMFVGLELKRIKQMQWTVEAFWERYEKAGNLSTFRAMFPEAETLQSLLSRMTALRVQCELYNRLIIKHKQQHDVQNVLLQSHSNRIEMYEAKMKPLQELTNALKARLSVQEMQMSNQEALLNTHRLQIDTQSKQMAVQQMLITQLGRTINNQEDKIRLLEEQLESKLHGTCKSSLTETTVKHSSSTSLHDKLPSLRPTYSQELQITEKEQNKQIEEKDITTANSSKSKFLLSKNHQRRTEATQSETNKRIYQTTRQLESERHERYYNNDRHDGSILSEHKWRRPISVEFSDRATTLRAMPPKHLVGVTPKSPLTEEQSINRDESNEREESKDKLLL